MTHAGAGTAPFKWSGEGDWKGMVCVCDHPVEEELPKV